MIREEREPASAEVTEVGPGVLRAQLPIQLPGLGHVNMYVIEDSLGLAVVDPGLPGPLTWRAIKARFRTAGLQIRHVHTVLITHSHPDHFGGAGRLAEASGASVVTHAAFRSWMTPHQHGSPSDDDGNDGHSHPPIESGDVEPEDLAHDADLVPWGGTTPWGGEGYTPPLKHRMVRRVMRSRAVGRFAPPRPTRRVSGGEHLSLANREWLAVHTPGHTLDHLCLHDPESGLFLSGDHVLPTITPHISGIKSGRDPLGLFMGSLRRVADLVDVGTVLPAHGHPFSDLRARAEAIAAHHDDRMRQLFDAGAASGPATVSELTKLVFKPRSWGPMAESETYAHLEHLRLRGQAERFDDNGLVRYRLDADAPLDPIELGGG